MTVYLAFNECEVFTNGGSDFTSSTECAVASVSRAGFRPTLVDTTTTFNEGISFTNLSEGWVHFNAIQYSSPRTNSGPFFQVIDNDGNTVIQLNCAANDGSSGEITVASSLLGNTGNTLASGQETLRTYDIHIKIASTGGFIRLYIDGNLVYDETGDTVASTSATGFDTIRFLNQDTIGLNAGNDEDLNHWGQVLVSDENTINAKVYTLTPTAGSTNDWPTGSVTDVDETDADDTDQAYTDTDNDQFTIDTSVTLPSVTSPVKYTALVQSFRASYDSGSPVTKLTPFLNDTTATSTSFASSISLTTGLDGYQEIWSTDPADSSNWTASKINNYEFGLQADT